MAQLNVFRNEPSLLNGIPDQPAQVVGINRFGNVIKGPFLKGLDGRIHSGIGSDYNGNNILINLLNAILEFYAVHSRHLDVQQDNVP